MSAWLVKSLHPVIELVHYALWWVGCSNTYYVLGSILSKNAATTNSAGNRLRVATLVITAAVVVLLCALLLQDFSVTYVAAHSSTWQSPLYRAASMWAGNEGSWLVWCWLHSLVFLHVTQIIQHREISDLALRIQLLLWWYLLLYANPFLRNLPIAPFQGADLHPSLHTGSMLWHPPLLYLGHAALSAPGLYYAYAIRDTTCWSDKQWQRNADRWSLLA